MKQTSKAYTRENEKIVIASPDYLENLGKLLIKTDKRTLANYLAWRAAKPFMTLLNEDARKIRQKYRKAIKGILVIIKFNRAGKNCPI